MNTSEAADVNPSLDSRHTHGQAGLHHAFSAVPASIHPPLDHVDRDAFGLRLQRKYHQFAVNDTPFLLIAMRGDSNAAKQLDFSLLCQCALKLLTKEDDWLVDLHNKRLVLLLPDSGLLDARRFFARLRLRLLETIPDQAEAYLYAVAAITLANGEPFQTAEDFLSVALDEV